MCTVALSLVLIFMIPWEGVIQNPSLGIASKILGLAVAAFWVATVIITGRLREMKIEARTPTASMKNVA